MRSIMKKRHDLLPIRSRYSFSSIVHLPLNDGTGEEFSDSEAAQLFLNPVTLSSSNASTDLAESIGWPDVLFGLLTDVAELNLSFRPP